MYFIGRQQNGDFEADLIKFGEKMELECRQVIYKIVKLTIRKLKTKFHALLIYICLIRIYFSIQKTITEVVKKEKPRRNSTKFVVNNMAEMYRRMRFFKKSFPLLKIDIGGEYSTKINLFIT
jgi:hypothetical protein